MKQDSAARTFIDAFKKSKNFKVFATTLIEQKSLLPEVVSLASCKEYPYASYSSWIISHVQLQAPELIPPILSELIDQFLITKDHSAQRNLLLVIYRAPFTDFKEGEMVDYLFTILTDASTKVALKVNAIYALIPYLKRYPELIHEFSEVKKLLLVAAQPSLRAAIRNTKH